MSKDEEPKPEEEKRLRKKDGDGDDPRDTPPPTIYGEEIEDWPRCEGDFLKPNCKDKKKIVNKYLGTICFLIMPGSQWTQQSVYQELISAQNFYKGYCIYLNFKPAIVSDKMKNHLRQINEQASDVKKAKPFIGAMEDLQKKAKMQTGRTKKGKPIKKRCKALIVFGDHYYALTPRVDKTTANQKKIYQIGIQYEDAGKDSIVSHELGHMLGKSSPSGVQSQTWNHKSICKNSIMFVSPTKNSYSGNKLELPDYYQIKKSPLLKKIR